MHEPKLLTIKNFMSHEDSVFAFINNQATLIYGKNNTDEGQVSNGSGKSVLLESITALLLGTALREDVTLKDLVRNGQEKAILSISLYNSLLKEDLLIVRTIYSNTKSSELQIYVNDQLHPVVSVLDGNSFILSKIGISKEDLLNFFLISKEKYTPFLSMGDRPKRDMISRFSQADLIDPVFDSIKSEVLGHETEERSIQRTVDSLTGKLEVLNEQKESLSVQNDNSDTIKELKSKIVQCSESNIKLKDSNYELTDFIKDLNTQLDKCVADKSNLQVIINSYNENRNKGVEQYNQLNSELRESNQLLSQREKDLLGLIECPKCHHEFIISKDVDIKNTREEIIELKAIVAEITIELDQCVENGKQLAESNKSTQLEYDQTVSHMRSLEQEISAKENAIRNNLQFIESNDVGVQSYKTQITNLENENNSTQLKEINISINAIQKELKDKNKELLEVQQKKADSIEWIGNFNKFKIFLSNKAIGVVQVFANEYLSKMKSSLSLQIEGYKINKDGSLRDNITATVLRDGMVCGAFGKFSSGERARINIALILSLQRLINMNSSTGGLDLCFLDEIIESVDSEGIYSIIQSLNELNQTIIVITHGSIDKDYPNTVLIEKTNGISIIKQN